MRSRTFILLILVLLVLAAAVVLFVVLDPFDLFGGATEVTTTPGPGAEIGAGEPGMPPPTATPAVFPVTIYVAKTDLPAGTKIRADLLETEERPNTNVALVGGYAFFEEELEELVGQYTKVDIVEGQAILGGMITFNPTDLSSLGSDLALYIEDGEVAVAFPIDKMNAAAYAIRPGDYVDVFMSLNLVDLDEEFNTILPNMSARVDQDALLEGSSFLLDDALEGRLEWIPELGQTAEIRPRTSSGPNGEEPGVQIPRRATQLTIQQVRVLWMGTWRPQNQNEVDDPLVAVEGDAIPPTPTPEPERFESRPDLAILSMPAQDALLLKWASEAGLQIDLVLRAQGDSTVFVTTSVSLPQIVEQGGLTIPEIGIFGLEPPINEVEPITVPLRPPNN